MLKEFMVAINSATLENLGQRNSRSPLTQQSRTGWRILHVFQESRSPLSQQTWRICVKGNQSRRYFSKPEDLV